MKRPQVAMLDLGAANRTSVRFALKRCGASVRFVDNEIDLARADALVVPGVANYGYVVRALDARRLRAPLLRAIEKNVPVLAICAGYQLLYESSEEAPGVRGLGLFPGAVRALRGPRALHMGWNRVESFDGSFESGWAYFAHGYAVLEKGSEVCAQATYGTSFAAVSQRGALLGVQFHPERSGEYGSAVLGRFMQSLGVTYAR